MLKQVTIRGFFLVCFLFLLFAALPSRAFNPESAELTFHTDTSNTSSLRYFFKLVYYTTRSLTVPAVSPTAQIKFSDRTPDIQVLRANRALLSTNATLYREVYYFDHTFPATGTFEVSFISLNRQVGYANITSSENISFFIQATVQVSLEAAGNRSPQFLAPPIKLGILGQPYRHNVTAYDPDGDSLVFKLVPALQYPIGYIPSYNFPEGATINNRTGEFIWPNPGKTGRYGIVVEVREYRQGKLIGKVMRELSLTIQPQGIYPVLAIQNRSQVPVNSRNQVFLTNNMPIKIRVAATNAGDLTAYSELFLRNNVITSQITNDNPREIELTITPNAALRRIIPYIITFRGTSPTANPEIFNQQDLTVALYFRSERATDQQDTTEPGEIPLITGIARPDLGDPAFAVYPNPVQGWFKIERQNNKPITLQLYNAQSQLVFSQNVNTTQTFFRRSSQMVPGIYFYLTLSEAGEIQQTGKLIFH